LKYDEVPRISLEESLVRIDVKDTAAIQKEERWPVSIHSDLLVIGEAFVPSPETETAFDPAETPCRKPWVLNGR